MRSLERFEVALEKARVLAVLVAICAALRDSIVKVSNWGKCWWGEGKSNQGERFLEAVLSSVFGTLDDHRLRASYVRDTIGSEWGNNAHPVDQMR